MFGISTTERGVGGSGPPKGDELPLDLQYDKAIDWLVGQRKVPRDWQRTLKAAQARLGAALALAEGRPELDALGALLATPEERFSYYEAAEVLEVLKGAGLAEKNFIGQYSNAYTAKWADAVRRYESGGVYLAEGAQRLVHQCTYELPALKKEVSRAEKELSELQRREAEYLRLAEAAQKRFEEACAKRKIGVCGRAEVRERLQLSLSQLRPLHLRAAALCQGEKVAAAAAFYRAFVRFCLEKAPADEPAKGKAKGAKAKASSPEETAAACLPTLGELQRLELPDDDDDAGAAAGGGGGGGGGGGAATGAAEIDWGGDDGGAGAAGGAADIDWGGGGDDGGGGGGAIDIDWGGGGDDGAADGGGGVAEIDWGGAFEIEEVAASAEDDGFGQLFDGERRAALLDDLLELGAFVAQRRAEMKSEGAAKGGLPLELQLDGAEVAAMAAAVGDAVAALDGEHARHLVLLRASDKYLGRQEANLCQMVDHAGKMRGLADELQERKEELALTVADATPKYQAAADAIRQLKGRFEGSLSATLGGRAVNVMGEALAAL